jgi:hypothetical protein
MINVKELRIGNYIYNEHNRIVEVTFQVLEAIYYHRGIYNYIPLTPEILLACGFKYDGNFGYSIKSSDDTEISFENIVDGILEPSMYHLGQHLTEKAKPKYLNQLQNLYFALMGEELEIKL